METKRVMVIGNPRSGVGRSEEVIKKIEKMKGKLLKKGLDITIERSEKEGERTIASLAKKAVFEGYDIVVGVGGDGTVREVASGLVYSDTPAGFIRAGNGNDFTRSFGIPSDIEKAFDIIARGKIIQVDLMEVNNDICANVFGVGFDSKIAKIAEEYKNKWKLEKWRIGSWNFFPNILIYAFAVIKELFFELEYPYARVELYKDGELFKEIEGNIILISIANGPTCGGIFRLAPAANQWDGKADVCWVGKASKKRIVRFAPRAINIGDRKISRILFGFLGVGKSHLVIPEVETMPEGTLPQATSIIISSPEALICQVDGEILIPQKEYKISVLPEALKLIVP